MLANLKQHDADFRRSLTNLYTDLLSNKTDLNTARNRFIGLKAVLKVHDSNLTTLKQKGIELDEIFTTEYIQKWEYIDEMVNPTTSRQNPATSKSMIKDVAQDTIPISDLILNDYQTRLKMIPKFTGKILEFRPFWYAFSRMIDNPNVSEDIKVISLMMKLEGTPKTVAQVGETFDEMKQLILEAYGNPNDLRNHIVNQYITLINKVSPIKSRYQTDKMLELIRIIRIVMAGLKYENNLSILCIIRSKLLARIPKETERRLDIEGYNPLEDIKDILKALETEITIVVRCYET